MGSLWQPTMLKVATCVVPREIISMLITRTIAAGAEGPLTALSRCSGWLEKLTFQINFKHSSCWVATTGSLRNADGLSLSAMFFLM